MREGMIPSENFDNLFWDYQGPNAGATAKTFCEQYENAQCIPLYISWKGGAVWPTGKSTGGGYTK
jgi:hypothetical protein